MANAQLRGDSDAPDVTIVEYPGANLRAVPPFSCSCPPDWSATEAPGALVVLRPPASPEPAAAGAAAAGAAAAELRVETVRVSTTTRLTDLAAANLARRRRSAPDLAVVTQKLGRFGSTPAHLCGAAWTDTGGGRVAQLQVVVLAPAEPGRSVVDAVILTGVCAEADAPTLIPEYVRIASSIRFGSDATPAPSSAPSPASTRAPLLRDTDDPFTTAAP